MPIHLRDYQTDLVKRGEAALAKSGSAIIQLETGAGKTHIAAKMCADWTQQEKSVWFVAHRQEILDQGRRIFDEGGIPHGHGERVQFRMITAASRAAENGHAPDVIIVDECQHAAAKTWAGMIQASPRALLLGLSATPGRLDGKPMGDYFAEIVKGPSPQLLRNQGHLAKYRYFAPAVPDLSKVKIHKTEFDRAEVEELMSDRSIVGDVVSHYRHHCNGARAILFACSVEASKGFAARFNADGIPALHVDAETPDDQRAAAIESLRVGDIKVICNVELFTEGLDLPAIDAVILMRPTRSLTLFRQMLGRGSRPSGEKTTYLDHTGMCGEHGFPNTEYEWTLEGREQRASEAAGEPRERVRRCPVCTAAHPWSPVCVECGHEYGPHDRVVTEIGGWLKEVLIPPGCVTRTEYARMRGINTDTMSRRVRIGLPLIGGFVDPEKADEWWETRRGYTIAKRSAGIKAAYAANPKLSANTSKRMKAALADPEIRAKNAAHLKALNADPEILAKNAERTKAAWANPELREKKLAGIKSAYAADPEILAKNTARLMALNADPEIRAKTNEGLKAAHADPEIRAKKSIRMKAAWADPKFRAKVDAGYAARAAKKASAQEDA